MRVVIHFPEHVWVLEYLFFVLSFVFRVFRYDYEQIIDEWEVGEFSEQYHTFTAGAGDISDSDATQFGDEDEDELEEEHLSQLELLLRQAERDPTEEEQFLLGGN